MRQGVDREAQREGRLAALRRANPLRVCTCCSGKNSGPPARSTDTNRGPFYREVNAQFEPRCENLGGKAPQTPLSNHQILKSPNNQSPATPFARPSAVGRTSARPLVSLRSTISHARDGSVMLSPFQQRTLRTYVPLAHLLVAQRTVACWPITAIGLSQCGLFGALHLQGQLYLLPFCSFASSPAYASISVLPL